MTPIAPEASRREETVPGPGGLPLFLRRFPVPDPDAPVLVFLHGLGAHSGWFAPMGDELARAGVASYAVDLPGHGRSGGARGDIADIRVVFESVRCVLGLAARERPAAPLFLGGLSLGALLALAVAADRETDAVPRRPAGYVVLSPPIADRYIPLHTKAALLATLPFRPTRLYGCPVGLGVAITCDEAANRRADADPLALRSVTLRTYYGILRTTIRVLRGAGRIRSPVLVLAGGRDRVARLGTTRWFVGRIGSRDKTLRVYEDLGHDLKLEPAMPEIARDVARWMAVRAGRPSST